MCTKKKTEWGDVYREGKNTRKHLNNYVYRYDVHGKSSHLERLHVTMHAWTQWGCVPSLGLHVSSSRPLQQQQRKSQPHPPFLLHQERTHVGWLDLSVLMHAHLSPSLKTQKRCTCWRIFMNQKRRVVLSTHPTPRCQILRDVWLSLSITVRPVTMILFHRTVFSRLVKWGIPIRSCGCFHSMSSGNVLNDTILASSRMLIQPWNPSLTRLFCLTTCFLVTSTIGVTRALTTLHPTTI